MMIMKESPISGIVHKMDIKVTSAQLTDWQSGMLIQHAMPHLTPDEREFIKTGITAEEWADL